MRKPDHHGLSGGQAVRDLVRSIPDVHHLDDVAPLLQRRGQVSHTEIALVLIADESHLGRYVILPRGIEARSVQHAGEDFTHARPR